VRSDAKASSAATTSGRGRNLLLALLAASALVLIAAAPASAAKNHVFLETFGSAAKPSFGNDEGLAIDQSNGNLLVIDSSNGTVSRWAPDGTAADFSALGTNVIDGQGGADLTPQNGLSFGGPAEIQIAVDNSGAATDGNIYVTQSGQDLVDVFASSGAYLGQLTAYGATPFGEPCGVAVDSGGNVYVGDYSAGVHKFVPAANPPVDADNTATFTSVSNPCTLAAGAGPTAGFIFVAQWNGPLSKVDSSTGALEYVVDASNTTTVTVDPATGHAYKANGSMVGHYDASGAFSASEIDFFSAGNSVEGIAVRGSNGNLYLSRSGAASVQVYGIQVSPGASTGSASSVTATTATLNGTVNPDGVALTGCEFEYGTTTSYGQSAPCAESLASIGSGTSPVAVHADIAGLAVGTEYHFRLVAENAEASSQGADEAFVSDGPVIEDSTTEAITTDEALLKAKIDPQGQPTTYHFEWGTTASYGQSSAEAGAGSDSAGHVVLYGLEGLTPGITYHWRVVATSSAGTAVGPDRSFTTHGVFVPDTDCPNQALRYGPSAKLPDCRAYEMVSPVDKGGLDIVAPVDASTIRYAAAYRRSTPNGGKLTFTSRGAFADSLSRTLGNQYIATRTPDGWSTRGINAPKGPTIHGANFTFDELDSFYFKAFTPDLSSAWIKNYNLVPLAPGAREGVQNLYRRDNTNDSYEAVTTVDPLMGAASYLPVVVGYTDDGSKVFLQTANQLTPDAAPNGDKVQIYEFSGGQFELISVLPGETASPENNVVGTDDGFVSYVGKRAVTLDNAVSEDGSRVFWTTGTLNTGGTAGSGPGKVYVRIDGETTVPVSESVTTKPSEFWTASSSGSKALFSFEDDPTGEDRRKLYVFDVDEEESDLIASEVFGVAGASDDLSRVYFDSREVLDDGATAGERNLYLWDEGAIEFIVTLAAANNVAQAPDAGATVLSPYFHNARVTPDGSRIAFMSLRSLTGYDNRDAATGEPISEVFLYDAEADELICASCNPSGARPVGGKMLSPFAEGHGGGSNEVGGPNAAAWIPTREYSLNELHPLSADGSRLFFNAFDALVPQDSNGVQDVYQWEAPGSGTCKVGGTGYSPQNGGCISLISTGQGVAPQPHDRSVFIDASLDGSTVFFKTRSDIDPEDPGLIDIYAARVGGGYPRPAAPNPCVGDACQSVPPAPSDPTPASASFRGADDPAPRKQRSRCKAARKRAGKASAQAKREPAKRCRRVKRRAGR
jgi:hypothetical protein